MTAAYFLTTLGLVPYFASRAMLPLFMTALVLRLGSEWEFLHPLLGVELTPDLPAWASSNPSLVALGVAALLEGVLQREPTLREKLSLTDAQLKAALAVLLCLVLAPQSQPVSQLEGLAAAPTLAWLGVANWQYAWAGLIGVLAHTLARHRNRLFDWLTDLDDGDDFGLQRLLSRLEEVWGTLGTLVLFLVPALAAGAALGAVICGVLLARRVRRSEHAALVACEYCQSPLEPCAPHCPECRTVQSRPRAVGLLGRNLDERAGRDHALSLKQHKRCTYCGTRLRGGGVDVTCARCRTPAFSSRQSVEAYLQTLSRNIPSHLLILAALGAVPVFGLFAGILYYRVTLVAAIRQYAPTSVRVWGRWALRAVNGVLLLLQPVPVLGMVTLPLMALTNVWFYTKQVEQSAARVLKPKDYSETLRR